MKGLKIYIHADMEGVAGVVSFEDCESQSISNYFHRQRMRRLLTGEVNAAVKAARDSGAKIIYVNDSHGSGYNIIFEELEPEVEIIHGRTGRAPSWLPCLDGNFDAVIAIGQHAMAGTRNANLPHSLWHINNGEYLLSETSMCAALAGYFDVPFIFVSGDQEICKEMKDKIPEVEVGIVKFSLGPYNARILHPVKAQEIIYNGTKKTIDNLGKIKPFKIPGPYSINISDRDPSKKLLKEDVKGEDFFQTVLEALNKLPWNKYGSQGLDDYKYPDKIT